MIMTELERELASTVIEQQDGSRSSVIVTELERELPSTVLTEYARRIAQSLRPKVIALR